MYIYTPLPNKYYKWYMNICNVKQHDRGYLKPKQAKILQLTKHHILPDSFFINSKRKSKNGWLEGNPDDPSNLVYLTNKEHFIVHRLLIKCYEGKAKAKMVHAFMKMAYDHKQSKYYEIGRRYYKETIDISGDKNPNFGKRWSKEQKKHLSNLKLGCKGHPHTQEHKEYMSRILSKPKIIMICQQCFKEYEVIPSQKEISKYCSRKCQTLAKNTQVTLVCNYCGIEYNVINRRKHKSHFCSISCGTKHRAVHSPDSFNHPKGPRLSVLLQSRDPFTKRFI